MNFYYNIETGDENRNRLELYFVRGGGGWSVIFGVMTKSNTMAQLVQTCTLNYLNT